MTKKVIVNYIMVAVRWMKDNGKPVNDILSNHGQATYLSMELLERTLGYKNKSTLLDILTDLTNRIYA